MRDEMKFVNKYELYLHNEMVDIADANDKEECRKANYTAQYKTASALNLNMEDLDFNEYEDSRAKEVFLSAIELAQRFAEVPEPKKPRKKFMLD